MLSITKLQNLKAIHNCEAQCRQTLLVVINHKTTKFESNSQLFIWLFILHFGCYQSQNYKIWKQFTTIYLVIYFTFRLLSITKLQNLKAIHNGLFLMIYSPIVVINHKTTKFESNSQRNGLLFPDMAGCYQSQNYKIWKQFTTR